MPKNKYTYKKLVVKVNDIVIPMSEYIIEDGQITFKEAPEPNAKIEFVLEEIDEPRK